MTTREMAYHVDPGLILMTFLLGGQPLLLGGEDIQNIFFILDLKKTTTSAGSSSPPVSESYSSGLHSVWSSTSDTFFFKASSLSTWLLSFWSQSWLNISPRAIVLPQTKLWARLKRELGESHMILKQCCVFFTQQVWLPWGKKLYCRKGSCGGCHGSRKGS